MFCLIRKKLYPWLIAGSQRVVLKPEAAGNKSKKTCRSEEKKPMTNSSGLVGVSFS
jgi:hypothetical protein